MNHYMLLARLLDYPTDELVENLGELRECLAVATELTSEEREQALKTIEWMARERLLTIQAHYVDTFDFTPEHSLHLTHHTHGESRERGPALVELSERYHSAGLERAGGELPDFLPLVLEFIGTCDKAQAEGFLAELATLLGPMAASLERMHSPYAPLIRLIERKGPESRSAA